PVYFLHTFFPSLLLLQISIGPCSTSFLVSSLQQLFPLAWKQAAPTQVPTHPFPATLHPPPPLPQVDPHFAASHWQVSIKLSILWESWLTISAFFCAPSINFKRQSARSWYINVG